MGNIWKEKVYTERIGCMGTRRTKQMDVLAVAEPREEAGWGRVRGQNSTEPPQDPACPHWRLKAQFRYWFLEIHSSDKKKTKPKTFKESCSTFPWETSQPSPDLPSWAEYSATEAINMCRLKATGTKDTISSIFLSSVIALPFAKALTMLETLEGSTCTYRGVCSEVLNGKPMVWAAIRLQTQNWKI